MPGEPGFGGGPDTKKARCVRWFASGTGPRGHPVTCGAGSSECDGRRLGRPI